MDDETVVGNVGRWTVGWLAVGRVGRTIGAGILLFVVTLCSPGAASAQTLDDRPTAGVALPWDGLLSDPDAAAVELNPAGLAFLRSWNIMVAHMEMDHQGRHSGMGTAVLWGQKIPLLPLSYGVGLQYVRWPHPFVGGYGNTVKATVALAWKFGWWGSLGMSYHHFFGVQGGLSGLDTLDLALFVRPANWFAAALALSDVTMPRWWQGLPLQRTWNVEFGFRPLGTDRLTLSVGAKLGERRREFDPRFRVQTRLWRGFVLAAEVEYRHRHMDLDRDGHDEAIVNDVAATLALEVDFATWGFGGAVALQRRISGLAGGVAAGGGAMVRVSGERYPSLVPPKARAVVVSIRPGSEWRFSRLLLALDALRRNPHVAAVVFKIADHAPGWAQCDEVRQAMTRLHRAGKLTVAFVTTPSNRAYYVASAADRVWLAPSGGLLLAGMTSTRLYFRKALDRLGVHVDVLRHAEYKTAPNMFSRTSPSREENEVVRHVLAERYGQFIGAVASRGAVARRSKARRLMTRAPFAPTEAAKVGLADAVLYGDEIPSRIEKLVGRPVELVALARVVRRDTTWGLASAVAVIVVEGDLVPGKSRRIPILGQRMAGHKTLVAQLRKARFDSRIKAVVLRINSPGGFAQAADVVWRQIRRLARVKPVVASLGNVAASGGYELAVGATHILCDPSTITGSIGIFVARPVYRDLTKKLGIGVAIWKKGPHAGLFNSFVPYGPAEKKRLTAKLRLQYMRFVGVVAKGRKNLSVAQVERLARGRVWTCGQAVARGLADSRGGLIEAIGLAGRLAHLDRHPRIVVWPKPNRSVVGYLVSKVFGSHSRAFPAAVLDALRAIPASFFVASGFHVYARLPYRLVVQ
ncbi:MAG: S49 family peptidase [Deltaproteobacteria bacterium]|nr:S49 family peptidase [Deltaproteobacteria bacterium]